jgi:hypothetical protein
LIQFIKTCVDPDPAKRGSFLTILRGRPFAAFYSEYLDATRGEARAIWNVQTLKMPWGDFVFNWGKKFSKPVTVKQEKALRILLNVPYTQPVVAVVVVKAKFEHFLGLFGPITQKTVEHFWHFTNALLAEEWFHGEITDSVARDRLRSGAKGNNNYLVRLNTGAKTEERDEPFILCYRMETKGKTKTYEHGFRIRYDSPQTLTDYVTAAFKEKTVSGLAPCGDFKPNSFTLWLNEPHTPVPSDGRETKNANVNMDGGYVEDTVGLGQVDIGDD